jgi:hypothetical protein
MGFSSLLTLVTKVPILSLSESITSSGLVGSLTPEYDYMGKSTWMLILGGELGFRFSLFTIARCSDNLDSWLICGSSVIGKVSINLTSWFMIFF